MQSIAVLPAEAPGASEFGVLTLPVEAVEGDRFESARAPRALYCARGHGPGPTIALVCADEDCENNLVVWPAWFSRTVNRQLFVNALRTASLGAALALGYIGMAWPAALVAVSLTFLLLSVLLREHRWAEQRTLIAATAVISGMYALRLPQLSSWQDPIVSVVAPIALTGIFVRVGYRRRLPGRLGYVPFFAAMAGAIGGLAVLDVIAHVHGLSLPGMPQLTTFMSLLELGLKTVASAFVGSVIVGGVLAGRARALEALAPTRLRGPRLQLWNPPRIVRQRHAYQVARPIRSLIRVLDTMVYLLAVAFRSISMQTCNAFVRGTNRLLARVFAIINVMATLARRFARRLAVVVSETVLLVRDGCAFTRQSAARYTRFYLLPIAALVLLGRGIQGIQDSLAAYVLDGSAVGVAGFAASVLVILVSVSALAGLQTRTNLLLALQAVLRGLVEPAVGSLLFFILLSVGLALSGNLLGQNPYRIGPVTVGALLLVVGGFGLQMALARRGTAPVVEAVEKSAPPAAGAVARIAPAVWSTAVLGLVLMVLTVIDGGRFI